MVAAPPLPPPEVIPKGPVSSSQVTVPMPATELAGQQPGLATAQPTLGSKGILHLDNADVVKALEMVSREANLNISIASGVRGQVTLDLRNKTAGEALQIIAQLCHLMIRREGDVIFVLPESKTMSIRVYHLNYITGDDLKNMLGGGKSMGKIILSKDAQISSSPKSETGLKSDVVVAPAAGQGGAAMGGPGESTQEVKAGGNSNAGPEIVVVQDYEENLKKLDRVVAEIDVQPTQVLIEAVIVQVQLNKQMQLGVNFALLDTSGNALGLVGDGSALNAAAGFAPASMLAANGLLKSLPTDTNYPAGGFAQPGNGLKFGWTGGSTTGFIKALETFGETRVLASPRLLVLNKQRAEIQIGQMLGYMSSITSVTSTMQTVNFLPIGTQLRLRPFVEPNGLIRMEIHPERSTGQLDNNGIPQTYTNQCTTNMIVPDGATIMIGGMIDTEVDKDWQGLPFLSRLPFVGYLFRNTTDNLVRKELIVLVTPHIWNPKCPQALNYLGRPRTENLDCRVRQQQPFLEVPGEESLYRQIAPSH